MATAPNLKRVPPPKLLRVRHLQRICARNLCPLSPSSSSSDSTQESKLCHTYYTLHKDPKDPPFYESAVVPYSLNPSWPDFDLTLVNRDLVDVSSSKFFIKVWGVDGSHPLTPPNHDCSSTLQGYCDSQRHDKDRLPFSLCMLWKVDLGGLIFLQKELEECNNLASDSLLFCFAGGVYAPPTPDLPPNPGIFVVSVDASKIKNSFNAPSLMRLHTSQRAVSDARVRTTLALTALNQALVNRRERDTLKSKVERLRQHVKTLRAAHAQQALAVQTEKKRLDDSSPTLKAREEQIKISIESLLACHRERRQLQGGMREHHDELRHVLYMVGTRQTKVILDLAAIFPITQVSPSVCAIFGIELPNSDFSSVDDDLLAAALGYVSQLVLMISKYLDLPLRYPLSPMLSRSTIKDFSSPGEKEKEYPLYPKVKDRVLFDVGVSLLNKNIQQLLNHCGKSQGQDIRPTLPHLRTLIKHFALLNQQFTETTRASKAVMVPADPI